LAGGGLLLLFISLALWVPAAVAAPPANDDFANRESIGGSLPIETPGSNVGATEEAGESLDTGSAAGHSVWFKWQAPGTGWTTIGSCYDAIHPIVAIFEGTALDSLHRVARTWVVDSSSEGPHCSTTESEYTFMAKAGTTYAIAVDGNTNPSIRPPVIEGEFTLRIESTPPPSNDDFENAISLERVLSEYDPPDLYRAPAFGYNWGAGKQVGEPDHAGDEGGASVWYSWTAPVSGLANIRLCCSFSGEELGIYTGDTVDDLAPVAETGLSTFPVVAGQTYRIAVDGQHDYGEEGPWMGSFVLSADIPLPSSAPALDPAAPPLSPAPDASAPRTTIVKRRLMPLERNAAFRFRSSEADGSFRCRLDGRPFTNCRSPKTYRRLRPGRHTFEVTALDAAGNRDATPAIAKFQLPK
jgi:hypothetical protein